MCLPKKKGPVLMKTGPSLRSKLFELEYLYPLHYLLRNLAKYLIVLHILDVKEFSLSYQETT